MPKHSHQYNVEITAGASTASFRSLFSGLLLLAVLFLPVAQAAWQPAQYSNLVVAASGDYGRWWQTWNEVAGSTLVKINDVYVDSENRILSAGYIDTGVGSVNLYVARHDSDGTLLWQDTYDGGLSDEAVYITQDLDGNVLVAGASDAGTGSSQEANVIVLKYDLNGTRLWSQLDNISGNLLNARAAKGASGELYVAATHDIDGFFNKDIVLLRFDTTGSVSQLGSSYTASTAGGAAVATDIAVAPDGTIVIAGTSDEATKDIVVLKYNADGTVPAAWAGGFLSSSHYAGWNANDSASALHIDAAGDIYVAG